MQFNLSQVDLISFLQSLKPLFFIKVIFILFILGYCLYQFIVYWQIKSMEKIITQPVSSAIVSIISLAFMVASAILIVVVWMIPV
ncbi:MAG: hypothetical protein KGJ07_07275 [Patescibacteria group bacterium]|nr:hypothetical protein [Patescibacteria group bacterium]MDE2589830.1 hypothetical protein [Patescibacteria group bacterium]